MIIANNKPVMIIGFEQSTLTNECHEFLSLEERLKLKIISPDDFLALTNKESFQYVLAFALNLEERQKIYNLIDKFDLDCITYIHDTCVVSPTAKIGKGCLIGPFSSLLQHSILDNYCIIESYCLVSHYVEIGKNTILHSGTKIAGKTKIGNNCMFNFNSSVINNVKITDNVILGANSNITKNVDQPGYYLGSNARKYKVK